MGYVKAALSAMASIFEEQDQLFTIAAHANKVSTPIDFTTLIERVGARLEAA